MVEKSLTDQAFSIETSRHWSHILKEVGFALDQSQIYELLLNEYKSGNKNKDCQKSVPLCNSYPMLTSLFFTRRFTGYPGHYSKFLGLRSEEVSQSAISDD